jgi:flagellar secretion chaperone FliS
MTAALLRGRYVSDSISTASPAQLLIMLYDRLVLDLQRAEVAQRGGDREEAHAQLAHAQDIVLELRTSLDPGAWTGGGPLSALYAFLLAELVQANVTQDAERTVACRALVEPLRDAWREAAALTAGEPAAAAATTA